MSRPNVILITCHDLGQHLGCYGIPTVDTPNVDGLAAAGVRFRRSFCVAPQCSPSRAAMVTGRYPHANGVLGLVHGGFKWDLHENETHLVRRFGAVGYATALIGIQHETREPQRMGYDEVHRGFDDSRPEARALQCAACAGRWLSEPARKERPFFLQFGLFEPHRDPGHPTCWPKTHQAARAAVTVPGYLENDAGAVEEMGYFEASARTADEAVGEVLSALEREGLAEDTLVIFTADHGIPFPRAKCTLYDPGLEVPLILRWPRGPWRAGTVREEMVSNVDYTPTLCDLLDLPAPESPQGVSFAPLLSGQGFTPRREVFAEMTYHDYYDPIRAIRTETHKLIVAFCSNKAIMNPTQQWRPRTTALAPGKPLASRHALVELYDLRSDPLEHRNLADDPAQAELKRDLLARLNRWMADTADPLLTGIPMSPMHHEALAALRGG